MAINLKKLCQTMNVYTNEGWDESEDENQENNEIAISITHKLPQPNPIFQENKENKENTIKSIFQLKFNPTQPIENYGYYEYNEPLEDFQYIQNQQQSLMDYLKQYQLIYQKYKPQNEDQYFSTFFYDFTKTNEKLNYLQNDDTLIFDSMFESGNLFQAYKKNSTEYILVLQNDVNTKGYNQWFYFMVNSKLKDIAITFNIINLVRQSLYHKGMKILVYEGQSWRKDQLNLQFFKNNISRGESQTYNTLKFQYIFQNVDQVYFAANYPYTYTDLKQYLNTRQTIYKNIMSVRTYAITDAQNDNFIVTISNPNQQRQTKQGIVIIARQHPGETAGSFICEGLMEYLLSQEADGLRNQFIIKIIPMLNVDGVIHGNQRCSLKGYDLNRKWNCNDDSLINETKKLISQFNRNLKIQLVIDLHAHSRKLNSFFYGQRLNPFVRSVCSSNEKFNLEQCRFMNPVKQIEQTARVVISKMLNLKSVFTLETSYLGYQSGGRVQDFTISQLKEIGKLIAQNFNQNYDIQDDLQELAQQLSQSDSDISIDEIKVIDQQQQQQQQQQLQQQQQQIRQTVQIPILSTRKCVRSNTTNKKNFIRQNKCLNKDTAQPSYSQHLNYNFISENAMTVDQQNLRRRKSCKLEELLLLQSLQQQKQQITPQILGPQHSLKYQFHWHNQIRKQKELEQKQQSQIQLRHHSGNVRGTRLQGQVTEIFRRSTNSNTRKPLLILNI